jgi:NAD(P)-dependent dehydrogenase (short-subunit alcohol dehydrogenase family)
MRFQDKIVFITGAGMGIGAAIAKKFSSEGAKCILTDINLSEAEKVTNSIGSEKGIAVAMKLDVTKSVEVEAVVEKAWSTFGKIDFLINNAGTSTIHRFIDLPEDEWDTIMNVNAKGMFLVTQAVVRRMLNHQYGTEKPKIVNIASKAGKDPGMLFVHYAASKHAVVGFTKAVGRELAPYGINVNCVCPGYVKTSMQDREIAWESELRHVTPDQIRAEYVGRIPMGRLENPQDVANVVAFLCSHDADYMTAQSINIDGGIVVF